MPHRFDVSAEWTGNRGTGTSGYRAYGREVTLHTPEGPEIPGSAARAFHGDAARWNPEELLLAALAECHLLSYLYLASRDGIVVVAYSDDATCEIETEGEGGRITEATLRPLVTISAGDPDAALGLHAEATGICFIAQSVAFPIRHEPRVILADDTAS